MIRFLYGRPLETLLLTWGVSLMIQQGLRLWFGAANVDVTSPKWLSGGIPVMVGLQLPYNRLFIIGLATVSVSAMYFLLFRTDAGLRIRAVTQNRGMAACLGVRARWVDAFTFAIGAGLAGLAGCALTQIGNVGPELGQNYIVDSFMVVVTGGVGKLLGSILAALGIGGLNKIIEPSSRRGVRQGAHPRLRDPVHPAAAVRALRGQGTLCGLVSGASCSAPPLVLVVVLPALNALPPGSPLPGQRLHPQPLRQVPRATPSSRSAST